ncbi:MAG: ABC-F family ATP-binding cassette domain-containing protein [Paramuribaculum sp.]|nr:ABC-F family ATP-binding cassette domain-containing protein [Paramuribaculum sp.]
MGAPLLTVENLTKSVGDRLLFGDVTFSLGEGDKVGIVAKNGTGKTSLLKLLAGKDSPDSGKITLNPGIKIGYLEQLPEFKPGISVSEACLSADTKVTDAIRDYHIALRSGADEKIAAATHQMDELDAWDFEDRMVSMLTSLKIESLDEPVDNLSGGQRKRVAIASVLLSDPDILIMDEPTNHLDIEIIEWLENYLSRQRVCLLMVTHDRYFLDRVCNRIMEIDLKQMFTYEGNFEYYLRRRSERYEALSAELDRVKNRLRRETEWMRRQPQARAGKAKYRIDSYYDLKERSQADYRDKNVVLDVKSSYIGNKIFEAKNISKRFGDKKIVEAFSYDFARYEKVGIVGANGVGKSTFIKMLLGIEPQDSGEWNVGETVRFGYYSQEGIELDSRKKVIDAVQEIAEDIRINGGESYSPMQFLKRFLFEPADQQKYIHSLSGGERCRLQLACVLMRSPNFLILDEPTNDLDIVTLGILEDYLAEYKGCIIVISHDRFFLDSIVDHLFVMEGDGKIKDFPGTYSEWRDWRSKQIKEENGAPTRSTTQAKIKTEKPKQLTYKEKKEMEALELKIDELTEEKNRLEEIFVSGASAEEIASASERYKQLQNDLDTAETRWLELSLLTE